MNQAFTLIELLIVIAIIGVLSAIAMPAYQKHVAKSLFASGRSQVMSVVEKAVVESSNSGSCIAAGESAYYTDNGSGSLGAYRVMTVVPDSGYEGCMVSGYFKSVANGGNAKLAGKIVRIHYVRLLSQGAGPYIAQCFTNLSASDLGLSSDNDCAYDNSWVTNTV